MKRETKSVATDMMQVKDIPDVTVLRAVSDSNMGGYDISSFMMLLNRTGAPPKVVLRKMEKLAGKGLIEYGTSINCCWLTKSGQIRLDNDS